MGPPSKTKCLGNVPKLCAITLQQCPQSPGRSDHSRDDSLIADDASSTGNKDDDDDDDDDDGTEDNDGFSRDPERLKAFNVSASHIIVASYCHSYRM